MNFGFKGLKVKLLLCLTKHHAIKTYGTVEVWLIAFITSALEGDEKCNKYLRSSALCGLYKCGSEVTAV
jgi:hypothetical protein